MRGTELLRLVWLNIIQNKFKSIMTSIGIVVGAATIVMVIAIGRGGQMDVAEQFSNLNAGAIDITYDWEGEDASSGGSSGLFGGFSDFVSNMQSFFGGGGGGGQSAGGGMAQMRGGGGGGQSAGGMDMSQMQGGGGGQGAGGMDMSQMQGGDAGSMPNGMDMSQMQGGDAGSMPNGMDMSQMQGGDAGSMPDGMDMSQMQGGDAGSMPDGMDMSQMQGGDAGSMPDGMDASQIQSEEAVDGETEADTDAAAAEVQDAEEEAVDEEAADEDTDDEEDSIIADRLNQEQITLTEDDVDDLETFIPGISEATISYTTRSSIEGGNLTDAQTYTVAGVTENFASLSRLDMAEGEFITASDNENKSRICVLGASAAKELFGSAMEAYDSTIYIDDRAYVVNGVLSSTGMVSAGISPDDAIFVPYNTGLKYITGTSVSPTITVISEDVDAIDTIIDQVSQVLAQNYSNAEFTYSDAGSKMEAAESSNQILTMLLSAMAVIVFLVGGIGIMNVLFVSVKERTNEIGILKALGASRATILSEFLMESAAISLMGGVLGVGLSTAITPIVEYYGVRVEANISAWMAALGFALLTGTIFGFYPAWKASRLVPVDALQAE